MPLYPPAAKFSVYTVYCRAAFLLKASPALSVRLFYAIASGTDIHPPPGAMYPIA